ncbi:MAG: M28 family peptidase [Prevotellaceae bacterium]|jgi:Zn-dependent M28 family amino/carboxypeptidase|nr:M28 family peptidase [Prevotellaceae bacterium]
MRLSILLAGILIFSETFIFAQKENTFPKIYNQLSDAEKYAVEINKNDLEEIVKTLCSPEFEGRRFGTDGNKKAMEFITSEFKKRNISKSNGNWHEQFFKEDEKYGTNIIGVIEGYLYPDENVIITCHYDGLGTAGGILFPSADDNATGVAALIEIAEAFSDAATNNIRPKRSIIFIAFDAGKYEMLGSKIYSKYPIKPIEKTQILLNMDMLGRDDCGLKANETNYVFLLGNSKLSPIYRQISDSVNSIHTHLNIEYDFYRNKQVFDLFYPTSDHYIFSDMIPAIFYTGGINADVHSSTDIPDKISYSVLRRRAQLVFYTAWAYANR